MKRAVWGGAMLFSGMFGWVGYTFAQTFTDAAMLHVVSVLLVLAGLGMATPEIMAYSKEALAAYKRRQGQNSENKE